MKKHRILCAVMAVIMMCCLPPGGAWAEPAQKNLQSSGVETETAGGELSGTTPEGSGDIYALQAQWLAEDMQKTDRFIIAYEAQTASQPQDGAANANGLAQEEFDASQTGTPEASEAFSVPEMSLQEGQTVAGSGDIASLAAEFVQAEREKRQERENAINELLADDEPARQAALDQISPTQEAGTASSRQAARQAASLSSQEDAVLASLSTPQGQFDVITLAEKVDGAAFAAALAENLDMAGIAYIQPDFALETFETKTIELTVDGDAGETEISSQTAEPAQSPEPEEPVGPPVPETTPEIEQTLEPEATQEPESTPEATPGQPQENAQPPLVALLDSWVDTQHEGLLEHLAQGVCVAEGAEDADLTHGTHVAGIIAQNAPNAMVLPLGVFVNGRAYTSDIVRAIWAAKDAGALVVNCSWGSSDNNQMLYDAMAQSGLLFVCAAGNNRADLDEAPVYPAAFDLPNVLSVASVNADLGLSYFTNYGAESVDVAAVGREVESTLPGDKTGPMTGTSQAAGVVSGIVAEYLAQDDSSEAGETAAELAERVKQTSRKLSSLDGRLAAGYIDAQNLAAGGTVTELEDVNPADDFDMWAEKTPQENWELFSAGKIVKVVNSTYVTLALLDDGTVWAWGTNTFKQLGTNANVGSSYTPVQIAGLSNVTDVSISLYCCLALKSDGTVWMWGIDFFGQMGRGVKSVTASVPGQTPGLTNIIKASMSFGHTLAASSTNVWSFGYNYDGQLGTGDTTNEYEYSPVQVITGGSISALYAAVGSRSYVCNNGEVYACGNNTNGKLGIGSSEANIATFTKLPGLAGASDIGNGMALVDGDVYTWGAGSTPETNLPAKVSGLSNVTAISHENNSWYLVVDADKNVWAWGSNNYGQLGDGTTVDKSVPTKISGLSDVVYVEDGPIISTAITSDGSFWAWGNNTYGGFGNGTTVSSDVPVKISFFNDLAAYDVVKEWDFNTAGDAADWYAEQHISALSVANGCLNVTTTGLDPILMQDNVNEIDMGTVDTVVVTMKGTTTGGTVQIYWGTTAAPDFSENASIALGAQASGVMHEYRFQVKNHAYWQAGQKLTRLRVDPGSAGSGSYEIDSIKLLSSDPDVKDMLISALGITFGYANGEDQDHVKSNIFLPPSVGGTAITWTSSHPEIIGADGTVYSDSLLQQDKKVTLCAQMTKNNKTYCKNFVFTVQMTGAKLHTQWLFQNDLQGWTPNAQVGATDFINNVYTINASGSNPYMEKSVSLNGGDIGYVEVVLKNRMPSPSTLELYWKKTGQTAYPAAQSVSVPITQNDKTFQSYVLAVGEHEGFSGTISGLRLDPTAQAGKIFIQSIRLYSKEAAPLEAWDFSRQSDLDGWTGVNQITSFLVLNGVANIGSGGIDPYMMIDQLAIDASKVKYAEIRMKNQTPGNGLDIFWGTTASPGFSPERMISIPITGQDGAFKTYQLNLSDNATWNGTVNALRLDPTNAAGNVQIDYIRLMTTDGDFVKLSKSMKNLKIGFADGENSARVKSNITLAANFEDAAISWTSDSPAISAAGVVTPPNGDTDSKVRLCATGTRGAYSVEKVFEVYVTNREYTQLAGWDFDSDTQGWMTNSQISERKVQNGLLQITANNLDPMLELAYECNTSDIAFMEVRMKNKSESREAMLYWQTDQAPGYSENASVTVTTTKEDSDFEVYRFNLSGNQNFAGNLTRLRFDPIYVAGDVEIDYIRLMQAQEPAPPQNPYAWEFNTDGDTEGWSVVDNGCTGAVSDGKFNITSPTAQNYPSPAVIKEGMLAPAGNFSQVEVEYATMRTTTDGSIQMKLSWTVEGEPLPYSMSLPLPPEHITQDGSGFAFAYAGTMVFSVGQNADWHGNITSLRLELTNGPVVRLNLDFIRLIQNAGAADTQVTVSTGDVVELAAKGAGITNLSGREFTVTYDSAYLTPENLVAMEFTPVLEAGTFGNVQIMEVLPGVVKFKLVDIAIPEGKAFSGLLNILRFKAIATGTTTVGIS